MYGLNSNTYLVYFSVDKSPMDISPVDDHDSEVDGAGVIEYNTTCIILTIIAALLALLTDVQ